MRQSHLRVLVVIRFLSFLMAALFVVLAILFSQLTGCALMPDAVPLKVQHVSHISQHFREHPTNLGYSEVSAGLKWKRGNFSVELDEGWTREPLDGMHEVTQASIEYDIPLHR